MNKYLNFRDRENPAERKLFSDRYLWIHLGSWENSEFTLTPPQPDDCAPYVRTLVHTPVASCLPRWCACIPSLGSLNSGFTSRPLSLASSSPHPLFGSLFGGLDFKGSWLMLFSVLSAWGPCCLALLLGREYSSCLFILLSAWDTAALSVASVPGKGSP